MQKWGKMEEKEGGNYLNLKNWKAKRYCQKLMEQETIILKEREEEIV